MGFKRAFDILFSILGLLVFGWFIILVVIIASVDTKSCGIFRQTRVGQYGKLFTIYKIRTINPINKKTTKIANFFRKSKIDELPQLLNVLIGNMSFVGPRPDIQGYYDRLDVESKKILNLKPGITCEASIKYKNEEEILASSENPMQYYDNVIFPDKIKLNLEYFEKRTLLLDLKILIKTILR